MVWGFLIPLTPKVLCSITFYGNQCDILKLPSIQVIMILYLGFSHPTLLVKNGMVGAPASAKIIQKTPVV